jgi:hypothetical protein
VTTQVNYDHISGSVVVVHQRVGQAKPNSVSDAP